MLVKYAVIGCGAIGQRRHIPECVNNPESKLVAVVDVNKARVEQIAAKYNAAAYIDYKQMLKDADIDAVVVATPNYLHAPMSIAAFDAGKHVLCEKPMATTRKDARAMIEAAKKNRKHLMIGMNQRLMPPHVKAKQILNRGELGKVLAFRTTFKHPGPDGWSVDGAGSWFFRKREAVMGVTGDLGVHKADLMRWLLGEEFVEISGFLERLDKRNAEGKPIDLDDNAYFTLKSKSGVIGSMETSWTNYGREENHTILYCQNGVLSLGADPEFGVMVQYKNGERELYKVGATSTNTRQVASGVIDSFTRCILNKRAPEIDGEEGYRALDMILTAMDAAKAGKTLKIGK